MKKGKKRFTETMEIIKAEAESISQHSTETLVNSSFPKSNGASGLSVPFPFF